MDREVSASCNKCKRSFCSKKLMKIHYMKTHYNRACPNCTETFQHTKKYLKHLRSHLNYFPYQCKICLNSFKDKINLRIHKIRHNNLEKTLCRGCAQKCDDHPSLLRHLKTHGEPPYECPRCTSRFSNLVDRNVHLKNHVLHCQLCKIPMKDENILLYHINEVHRIIKEDYAPVIGDPHLKYPDSVIRGECDRDDSMAESSSSESSSDDDSDSSSIGEPDIHVDSVYEAKHEDKFICFICLQLCPSSELLEYHMKAHNWCPCPNCLQFFSCYQDLEMHNREIHSPRCFICEATLELETNLNLGMAKCWSCSIVASNLEGVFEAVLEIDEDIEADIEQELKQCER